MRTWILGATLAAACGGRIDQADFAAEYEAALCDRVVECGIETDCEADAPATSGGTTTGCAYDSQAARDCVDAVALIPCDDVSDPYFTPSECAQVCI